MTSNFARLGQQVQQRRLELGMSQVDLWQAGGPSNSTITNIENGTAKTISPATRKKLDRGLKWAPGSADRILEGGEPMELRQYLASEPSELLPEHADPTLEESVEVVVSLTPRKVAEIQLGLSGMRDLVGLYGDELIDSEGLVTGLSQIEDLTTRILRNAIEQSVVKFGRLRYVEAICEGDEALEDETFSERMEAVVAMARAEANWIRADRTLRQASKHAQETGQKVVEWLRSFADKASDDPSKNPLGLDKKYLLSDELAWKAVLRMRPGPDGIPVVPDGPDPELNDSGWDEGSLQIAEHSASLPTMVDALLSRPYDSSAYLDDSDGDGSAAGSDDDSES
ncbi:helix-turn-helix transcriptional regulator [Rhodococcus erythropolis]|uniref:helix-turn-helix domain-containing protein n=1 Tax=Rhodococcus erythropolis TaxID=1833 RepID=UPI002949A394|nr:helix-turn-helix transcriptional regulator [Rhodococcus erythropolis]MDV6275409.1 helix-turn-helix transcriptional regulator [Rhodococcus erythropolis]